MRSSLIVLAILLATLRVVRLALARRVRGVALVPAPRVRIATSRGGDRTASRFAEWRYYGFSSHTLQTGGSSVESPDVVASSPAVGSVVSILPDDCVTTVVNGRIYRRCGSVWYQRQSTGSDVTYVVVPAP